MFKWELQKNEKNNKFAFAKWLYKNWIPYQNLVNGRRSKGLKCRLKIRIFFCCISANCKIKIHSSRFIVLRRNYHVTFYCTQSKEGIGSSRHISYYNNDLKLAQLLKILCFYSCLVIPMWYKTQLSHQFPKSIHS